MSRNLRIESPYLYSFRINFCVKKKKFIVKINLINQKCIKNKIFCSLRSKSYKSNAQHSQPLNLIEVCHFEIYFYLNGRETIMVSIVDLKDIE